MNAVARPNYEFDTFLLDPGQRLLFRAGEPVPLTPKLFETLLALVESTGLVVSKDGLMQFYGAAGNVNTGLIVGGAQDNGTLAGRRGGSIRKHGRPCS